MADEAKTEYAEMEHIRSYLNQRERPYNSCSFKATKKDIPCKFYGRVSGCKYGNNCHFAHKFMEKASIFNEMINIMKNSEKRLHEHIHTFEHRITNKVAMVIGANASIFGKQKVETAPQQNEENDEPEQSAKPESNDKSARNYEETIIHLKKVNTALINRLKDYRKGANKNDNDEETERKEIIGVNPDENELTLLKKKLKNTEMRLRNAVLRINQDKASEQKQPRNYNKSNAQQQELIEQMEEVNRRLSAQWTQIDQQQIMVANQVREIRMNQIKQKEIFKSALNEFYDDEANEEENARQNKWDKDIAHQDLENEKWRKLIEDEHKSRNQQCNDGNLSECNDGVNNVTIEHYSDSNNEDEPIENHTASSENGFEENQNDLNEDDYKDETENEKK